MPRADASGRVDRRLTRESAAARVHVAVATLLGLVTAALVVAQAALLATVIARAAVDHAGLAQLRGLLIALAAVFAGRALVAGGFELSGRLGALRVMAELRHRLARRLLIDRPGRRPAERTGELAAAAVQGVDALEAYFAGYLPSFVLATAVPVAVLIWVAPLDGTAALILALTIPILIVFMILIGKGAQARTRSRWRTLAQLSSHFLDVVRGLETLRAHRREHAQTEVLAQVGDRYRRETMATLRLAFSSALVLELCAMLGIALVAATVGVQLTAGHLSLQAGLTVLLLAPELYAPLRAVGQQFHASADGLAAAERLLAVLDEPVPTVGGGTATAPDPKRWPLRFERVFYEYPGRPGDVLSGLDLELRAGEFVALTGASGSGKSTVAALALRLADPTAGRVWCGPVSLRDVDPAAWQRRVAWVPQRSKLMTGTIGDNIALADPHASRNQIERAAREAGLEALLGSLPDGLDTVIGDGGRRLSAGQGQRVALARAFLRDASLVVLDEPTANLDAASAAEIGRAIGRLARGRTTLLIAHDRRLALHADRVLELFGGRVRELASAADLEFAA
jgi:thiol reductant ABC exporter CydD subunit